MSNMLAQKVSIFVMLLAVAVTALYFNQFQNQASTIRVCINFQTSGLQSTCVLCDASRYPQTSLACTGQASVPPNTNYSQAYCLINLCSNQVSQTPLNFGRKRRQTQDESQNIEPEMVKTSVDSDDDYEL